MEEGGHQVRMARYWNCNGSSGAIVALVTPQVNWAAYIGSTPGDLTKINTIKWVREYGAKITEADARYYFPEYNNLTYRH